MWGRWQWAQLGLPHLKILQTQANVAPKIPKLTGLTMNPGASWMSSVGTVRSSIAASPNTSSTIGTARVKRWAMKGKWAVSPFLWPGWKFKPRHWRWERSGFPVHRCYHSLHVIHASPPVCLVFYISLELAEPESEFMVLLHVPDPPLLSEWKQLQGYWCYGGKNVFISARTAGQTAAHSHSLCYAHLNSSRDAAYGGWDPDCCTEELKGWIFRSRRHICIWIGAAQCPTHKCCRLPKSELQSIFFSHVSLFLINSPSESLNLAERVTFSVASCT